MTHLFLYLAPWHRCPFLQPKALGTLAGEHGRLIISLLRSAPFASPRHLAPTHFKQVQLQSLTSSTISSCQLRVQAGPQAHEAHLVSTLQINPSKAPRCVHSCFLLDLRGQSMYDAVSPRLCHDESVRPSLSRLEHSWSLPRPVL
jgi:hypothetical protein